jgi:hypothetical protein
MKNILLLAAALLLARAVFVRTSVHSQTAPVPCRIYIRFRAKTSRPARSRVTGGLMPRKKSLRSTYLPETARESLFQARRKIRYDPRSDLKMRVRDVFEGRFGRQIQLGAASAVAMNVGASPFASVFYRLASDHTGG